MEIITESQNIVENKFKNIDSNLPNIKGIHNKKDKLEIVRKTVNKTNN